MGLSGKTHLFCSVSPALGTGGFSWIDQNLFQNIHSTSWHKCHRGESVHLDAFYWFLCTLTITRGSIMVNRWHLQQCRQPDGHTPWSLAEDGPPTHPSIRYAGPTMSPSRDKWQLGDGQLMTSTKEQMQKALQVCNVSHNTIYAY